MLLGARAKKKGILNKHASLVLALLCFGVYTYQSVFHFPKILGIFQLVIGVCFAYGLGCFLLGYEDKLKEIRLVRLISSVTLEAYIVHYIFIDVYAAAAFPTNLIYFVISLFGTAFCLQWAANKVLRVFPDFRMR